MSTVAFVLKLACSFVLLGVCESAFGNQNCTLPADTGPCRALVKRYFYNQSTGTCEPFTYGGCHGNGNRFKTAEECYTSCNKPIPTPSPDLDVDCTEPVDPGQCDSGIEEVPSTRYYYNYFINECEPFTWSGCGGNWNNFENKLDCNNFCSLSATTPEPANDNNNNTDDDVDVRALPGPDDPIDETDTTTTTTTTTTPTTTKRSRWRFKKMSGSCNPGTFLKIIDGTETISLTRKACARECRRTENCVAFTYYPNKILYPNGKCKLRSTKCDTYGEPDINNEFWILV